MTFTISNYNYCTYSSGFTLYLPPEIRCYWPLDEITPYKPRLRDTTFRWLKTAASHIRRFINRPIFQPVWSHLRRKSITSKTRQFRRITV